jgi:hypothetical protein
MGLLVGFVYNAKKDITDNEYIDIVKEGYLVNFSDVSVRNAFNYSFFEPYWRYYKVKTGEHVVELSGDITFEGEKGHAILQFVVDQQTKQFTIYAMKFNDVVLKPEQNRLLIGMVYETWHAKRLAYE